MYLRISVLRRSGVSQLSTRSGRGRYSLVCSCDLAESANPDYCAPRAKALVMCLDVRRDLEDAAAMIKAMSSTRSWGEPDGTGATARPRVTDAKLFVALGSVQRLPRRMPNEYGDGRPDATVKLK